MLTSYNVKKKKQITKLNSHQSQFKKMKSTKIHLKTNHNKKIKRKKEKENESKTLWITIIIHSAMSFNFFYFIKFNNMFFL
jgi:hypothetical protein